MKAARFRSFLFAPAALPAVDLVASSIVLLALTAMSSPAVAAAQDAKPLPSPLGLGDVIRIAGERRDEIQAARARTRAGEARPAIVSALPDPMISPSLDHVPFMLDGADFSVAIEQQIPLSGIRGHRRQPRVEALHLIGEARGVFPRRKCHYADTIGMRIGDRERAAADRPGRADDSEATHHAWRYRTKT